MPTTPMPGAPAPDLSLPLTTGGTWVLSRQAPDLFTMIIVYRSLHCPICKTYLQELHRLHDGFLGKGIQTITVSMDTEDRAKQAHADWTLDPIPMGYAMTEAQARAWGLWLSEARKADEPELFAEPGLFLVNKAGTLWLADVTNTPFLRPDLQGLLDRVDMMAGHADAPPRGMA